MRFVSREGELAVDRQIELARSSHPELDIGDARLRQAIPHTEGLGFIASAAAVLDQNLHNSPLNVDISQTN